MDILLGMLIDPIFYYYLTLTYITSPIDMGKKSEGPCTESQDVCITDAHVSFGLAGDEVGSTKTPK